ncbi:MAG TPA: NAD-dependent epimerase/dehydratase family protein, partial [Acidimicrobiales bacterium]|nr:NAD-dependent epimerase/dehydratase family protein [Acidimicrobiales bacterium]
MASGSGIGDEAAAGGGSVVVVTGAASALGRRVCALAAADPAVSRVVGLDRRSSTEVVEGVRLQQLELATADLKRAMEGADVLVHLAQGEGLEPEPASGRGVGDGRLAQLVLDAASAVGIEHVVLLSSATAYGAWANNPVPLTEEAPLRPNPGVRFASEKAELERVAADWRDDHPGATVAVLRPTVTAGDEGTGWLA